MASPRRNTYFFPKAVTLSSNLKYTENDNTTKPDEKEISLLLLQLLHLSCICCRVSLLYNEYLSFSSAPKENETKAHTQLYIIVRHNMAFFQFTAVLMLHFIHQSSLIIYYSVKTELPIRTLKT